MSVNKMIKKAFAVSLNPQTSSFKKDFKTDTCLPPFNKRYEKAINPNKSDNKFFMAFIIS